MLEKTVTLYFMDDGDLNGRIECTIGNWKGVVYKIPKPPSKDNWYNGCKSTLKERIEQPGIYFLFGKDPDSGQKTVYVGQSGDKNSGEGVWTRLNGRHKKNIDEGWKEVVIVIHDNAASFLGGVGLNYLENKFYWIANEANDAGYYKMLNGNEPNSARRSIRDGDKSEADDFAEHIKTVMRVLGYGDLFKASDDDGDKENRNMFRMSYKGHRIRMEKTVDGFSLQKGSWIDPVIGSSCQKGTRRDRKKYEKEIKDNKLTINIPFKTASAAAKFVCGTSVNGNNLWKNFEGEMLKDLEEKELQDDE